MTYKGSFSRDGNGVPDVANGCLATTSKIFVGNNTTVNVPIFTVAGSVQILGIWAVVTTVLGNHTAAYMRLNDATNTPAITVSTGVSLTSEPVGSMVVKKGLAAAALVAISSAAAVVSEPTTLETDYFSPFVINANGTVTTNVEYVYTTTDTPTSGAMQFFMRWLPLSINAQVTAL